MALRGANAKKLLYKIWSQSSDMHARSETTRRRRRLLEAQEGLGNLGSHADGLGNVKRYIIGQLRYVLWPSGKRITTSPRWLAGCENGR